MPLVKLLLAIAGGFREWVVGDFLSYLGLSGAAPATPPAGEVRLVGRNLAGLTLPAYIAQDGRVRGIMADLVSGGKLFWVASDNGGALFTLGGTLPTATGTATAKNPGVTTKYSRWPLVEYLVTTAAATAVAGFSRNVAALQIVTVGGGAAGDGGFHFVGQWGPATGVATATMRAAYGLSSSNAAPTDVEPSTLVNCIFMGWDAADTNVQILHNDATGACTKIDLGAAFPVPTVDRTNLYELRLYSPPGTTQIVNYTVINLVNGNTASGQITTNLPTTTTLIGPRGYCSVGGTSSVVGMGIGNVYLDKLL